MTGSGFAWKKLPIPFFLDKDFKPCFGVKDFCPKAFTLNR